ncbi:MAG: DoxX family protein [Chthoniobacterales bacterium]|nr:DoxX family protein [Chthoniobacterales bacterium]
MSVLHTSAGALLIAQLFVAAFFAILFLQSGVDKILDRRGNLDWLTGHFAKSPLAGIVPLLLGVLTAVELAAGILSALGFFLLLVRRDSSVAFYGAVVSGIALLALFFGQRMAKEYPGAASLAPYLLIALFAILALGAA